MHLRGSWDFFDGSPSPKIEWLCINDGTRDRAITTCLNSRGVEGRGISHRVISFPWLHGHVQCADGQVLQFMLLRQWSMALC